MLIGILVKSSDNNACLQVNLSSRLVTASFTVREAKQISIFKTDR